MEFQKSYPSVVDYIRNLMVKGKYNEALREYFQEIKDFSDEPDLRNIGGDILNRLDKKEEAILEYERCIELYREKRHYSSAIAICKKILRINSQYDNIVNILGDVYMQAGLVGEAIINYLKFAERKRKSIGRADLKEIFKKINDTFGTNDKTLINSFKGYPELKMEFSSFLREIKSLQGTQEKGLIEKIKRDREYRIFNELVEMELRRSRRYLRPFSIFSIELRFLDHDKESKDRNLEKLLGILKNNLRTIDYIFLNLEGFFYGMLPETPSDGVFVLSDRLVERLKHLTQDQIKVSMRWSTYPKDGRKMEDLLESLQNNDQVYFK